MTFLSVVFAAVGMQLATAYMERDSSMALISSGEPTVVDGEWSPATAADDPPPATGADPTTTTEPQAGAAASSSVVSSSAPPAPSVAERGRWALDQISYPWQTKLPGWTVEFEDGRDGLFGLTLVDDKRIEIYVRDDQTDELLVHIVAHELGHAVDVTLNDGNERRAWQRVRGIEGEPWWPDSAASDFRTGAGDFAESFAYWQAESDNFRSKLGPEPTADQLELLAELALD